MKRAKEFNVYGVSILASSLKEAKQKALAAMESLAKHVTKGPLFIKMGYLIGAIFPSCIIMNGDIVFCYNLFDPENIEITGPAARINLAEHGSYDSYESTERAMRLHAAQWIFEYGIDDVAGCVINEEDKKSHASWCKWQRQYKKLEATGLNDNQIREKLFSEGV